MCEQGERVDILVNCPLINFKKAVDKLRDHFGSKGRRLQQDATEIAVRLDTLP